LLPKKVGLNHPHPEPSSYYGGLYGEDCSPELSELSSPESEIELMHEEDMVEELDGGGMDQDINSDSEPEDGEIEFLNISPSAAALVRLLTLFLLKLQGVFHLSILL
jgi:hypothetical protein